ncbi:MAG: F0F1 ATP synthase subunit delta [Gammaproteobacteria bacterium]|nr:F0F1 ATP synthase subunit delta [Gammaproteobacteria bacterium]
MAELSTVARPYAQAVFELAEAQGNLAAWSDMLAAATMVAADEAARRLLSSPGVSREQVADLFIEVCGDALDENGRNLIRVLAENRRLTLLEEIGAQYATLRAEAEKTVEAQVISAFELSEAQQEKLADALKRHLGRDVRLTCEIDKTLIGGAVIHAGDLVIDGSAQGRLNRLAGQLEG